MFKEPISMLFDYMKKWVGAQDGKRFNEAFSKETLKEMEKWYHEFY